jgi:hypothetical protein
MTRQALRYELSSTANNASLSPLTEGIHNSVATDTSVTTGTNPSPSTLSTHHLYNSEAGRR